MLLCFVVSLHVLLLLEILSFIAFSFHFISLYFTSFYFVKHPVTVVLKGAAESLLSLLLLHSYIVWPQSADLLVVMELVQVSPHLLTIGFWSHDSRTWMIFSNL